MDDADRFWAEDYEGGSFKTWLRKKYKGPYLSLCHGEGYQQCKKDLEYMKKHTGKVRCEWAKSYEGEESLCGACQLRDNEDTSSWRSREIMKSKELEFEVIPVRALDFMFENYPGMLLERLPIESLLCNAADEERVSDLNQPAMSTAGSGAHGIG